MDSNLLKVLLKKNKWSIVLLMGLLLLVTAIPVGSSEDHESEAVLGDEARLKNILEKMDGIEQVSVMITYNDEEKVAGVVIVTERADEAIIVQRMNEVVHALFDVDLHKIKVIKGNQTQ